jgi:DNA polymerase-4
VGAAAGAHLAELARGHDPRPVVPEQEAKSIGHEETFPTDLWDREELSRHLLRMVDASATSLRGAGLAARTVNIKIRFSDFTMITRSHSMVSPLDTSPAIGAVATALLDSVELEQGVRLLGVSLAGFGSAEAGLQLSLDLDGVEGSGNVGPDGSGTDGSASAASGLDSPGEDRLARAHEEAERIQQSWGTVTAAVDAIRARFGGASVGPASLVGEDGIRVRRHGESQWGPEAPKEAPEP